MPKKTSHNRDHQSPPNQKAPAKYAYRSLNAHLRLWLTMAAGLAADLLSKTWAVEHLGNPQQVYPQPLTIIDGYVRFITVFNTGAVAGMAAGKTTLLLIASVVAIIFLLWLFAASRPDQQLSHLALGMLLAGAMGNMCDRLFNSGKVVDFIEINLHFWPANPWPTFNIADIFLTVGVATLVLSLLLKN